MPILADCHLHSHHSGDSTAPMQAQIEAAISHGLTRICFTEHMDFGFPYVKYADSIPPGTFDLDVHSYYEEYLSLKEKYAGKIRIAFGIEAGLHPDYAEEGKAFIASAPYDFVIGSTHLCDENALQRLRDPSVPSDYCDPYYPQLYDKMSDEDAYHCYFLTERACVLACDWFDSLGHLDYVVRYGQQKEEHYSYAKFRDLIDPMLETILQRGQALELNTAALSKGCRECNPCTDILRRYKELGGELITIGSDAHAPEKVASDLTAAHTILTSLGFRYYTVYENREPVQLPL